MARRERRESGYSLVEVLVVIAVLAILGGIIVFAVGNSTKNARSAAAVTERSTIRTALAAFRADTGTYPTAAQGLPVLAATPTHYLAAAPDPTKWVYDAATHDVIGVGAYASLPGPETPQITGTVTIFAATSLTNAFNDIKAKLTAVSPGLQLVMSYGGSATLKASINTGTSPADVFASADTLNAPNGPLVSSNQLFASNKLAIIAKPGNPSGIATIADLFTPGRQVILCQSAQPCGNASNQAFATIGKVRADLGANLVSETANVGLVTSAVTSGASNTVGLVYSTDAKAAGSTVATVSIPDANNFVNFSPIYQIVNPSPTANVTGAQQFISYVLSSEGQAILAARGFGSP